MAMRSEANKMASVLSTAALDCSSSGMVFAGRVVEFCCVLVDIRNGSFQAVSEVSSAGGFSDRSIVTAPNSVPSQGERAVDVNVFYRA
jgi:hypothetical protein